MCGGHVALGGPGHLLLALQFPRGSQNDVAPQWRRSNTCVEHQHGWELWQQHGGCLSAPIQTHTALLAVLRLGPGLRSALMVNHEGSWWCFLFSATINNTRFPPPTRYLQSAISPLISV